MSSKMNRGMKSRSLKFFGGWGIKLTHFLATKFSMRRFSLYPTPPRIRITPYPYPTAHNYRKLILHRHIFHVVSKFCWIKDVMARASSKVMYQPKELKINWMSTHIYVQITTFSVCLMLQNNIIRLKQTTKKHFIRLWKTVLFYFHLEN